MWIILDVILVAVLILFVVAGAKKGLIKSLCGLVSVLLALVISFSYYAPLSDVLMDKCIYRGLVASFDNKITEYAPADDEESVEQVLDDNPQGFEKMLDKFGVSVTETKEKFHQMQQEGQQNIVKAWQAYIVAPAAQKLSDALAVVLLFAASLLAVNVIIWLLGLIFKLPILRRLNGLLGGLIGLVKGALVCLALCAVLRVAMPYLQSIGVPLDEEKASHSLIYSAVSSFNPLYMW